jgi:hypothetical protein
MIPNEKKAADLTPYEKFVALARKVVQTPKAEVDKRERAWREERKRKRRA